MRTAALLTTVGILAALSGCGADPCRGKAGACLAVHVDGSERELDEMQVAIDTSDGATLHGDTGATTPPIALPVQFALRLPAGTHGSLSLSVVALRGGTAVAEGAAHVNLPLSGHGRADVTLHALDGGAGDGGTGDGGAGDGGGPAVGIAPDPLDLGEVGAGLSVTGTLTVTNRGAPLTVAAITLSGSTSFSRDASGTCREGAAIAQNDSCTLKIVYQAGNTPGAQRGHVDVDFGGTHVGADLRALTAGWVTESIALPNGSGFTSVAGSGPDDVWAGGSDGELYHRDATGTWTPNANKPWSVGNTAVDLFVPGAGEVWAVASTQLVYRTQDGGAHWQMMPNALGQEALTAIGGIDANNVFAGGAMGGIELLDPTSPTVASIDRMNTGEPVTALFGVGGQIYSVYGSTVYERQAANNWTIALDEGANAVLYGGCAVTPDEFYVVGAETNAAICGGTCAVVYHVSPTTGTNRPLAGTRLNGVWANSSDDVWAVGEGGIIYHSPGDDTWTAEPMTITASLEAVWGTGNELFVVGESGTILHRY